MELAAALLVTFVLVAVLISNHQLRLKGRETREDLTSIIRYETERLERKVDTFTRASSTASVLAKHAVASAQRAEEAGSRPDVVLVVSPAEQAPKPK